MTVPLATVWRLAEWLGPWTDGSRLPSGVERTVLHIEATQARDRRFHCWVYAPVGRKPTGAILLIPGLHHAGPADPRFDRLARILAHAGILTCAPFLPDFTELLVRPSVVRDVDRAFDRFCGLGSLPPRVRPGAMSISFGSLPALRLASARGDRLGGLVVFGGYAHFADAIRFSLEGAPGRPHDPLNRPAVFLNLVHAMDDLPPHTHAVEQAWRAYVGATWGRPEMKTLARHAPIARELAATLGSAVERELFLMGCGLVPGGLDRCLAALARCHVLCDALDPLPHLGSIAAPVFLVHGRDDDVIPASQSELLLGHLPPHVPARLHLTGLYGHSGQTSLRDHVTRAAHLPGEGRAMLAILQAIAHVASRPGARG